MRWAVVVFPGSNCDADAYNALKLLGYQVEYVWHRDTRLPKAEAVLLPGGFSHGDYLRPGSIARFAPIMEAVIDFAMGGGLVLGICNGFQILTEAGLLPGALLRNNSLQFRCQGQWLKPEGQSPFTRYLEGPVNFPIAHGDGLWYVTDAELALLESRGQIAFRYADSTGEVSGRANPNGALANVAGITNQRGNVLGLMPHPERAVEEILGSTDGARFFSGLARAWEEM